MKTSACDAFLSRQARRAGLGGCPRQPLPKSLQNLWRTRLLRACPKSASKNPFDFNSKKYDFTNFQNIALGQTVGRPRRLTDARNHPSITPSFQKYFVAPSAMARTVAPHPSPENREKVADEVGRMRASIVARGSDALTLVSPARGRGDFAASVNSAGSGSPACPGW